MFSIKKIINYSARILSIVIVGFFAIFILEGLSPQFSLIDSIAHLSITLIVLAVAIISWKYPKIGGFIFLFFGLFWLSVLKSGMSSLVIAGVPILTGVLFLIEGFALNKRNK